MDGSFWLLLTGLAGCVLVAGWPLGSLPRVRAVLCGLGGSTCIVAGMSLTAFLAAGSLGGSGSSVQAAETEPQKPSAASESASEPAGEASSASGSGAKSQPSEQPSDPQIDPASLGTVVIPPGRPEWVEAEPDLSSEVHRIAVSSGPYALRRDADRALDEALAAAASEYITEQVGHSLAPALLPYDTNTIKRRFVQPENVYREQITVSIGPMHQTHALLEFDREFRNELQQRWEQVVGASRLGQLGFGAGAALLLLAMICGYFRADHATRGYYSRRLQLLTAAAILMVVVLGIYCARSIHWL